ncbi:T9SS type A sorting domain-containing protein [Chitinophagaceae bacterium MMS25-I14]
MGIKTLLLAVAGNLLAAQSAEACPLPKSYKVFGADAVCANGTYRYDLAHPPSDAPLSYNWTLPATWTVWFGQGTESVYVIVGSQGGAVQCEILDNCGQIIGVYRTAVVTNNCAQGLRLYHGSEQPITLFPNPAQNEINFSESIENGTILVTGIDGRSVLTVNNFNGNKIDISNFAAGSYILKMVSDKHVQNFKFTKVQ